MTNAQVKRCSWCGDDPLYQQYHDEEWGVPIWDSRELFEKLVLDGAQAGLSWITILRKREGYRKAFDNFDPEKMASYTDKKLEKLMQNPDIVRNRLKINSARQNARAYLAIQETDDFSRFLWDFVGGAPLQHRRKTMADIPAATTESEAMSKALKKAGFNFVGPTIVYAFMQAVGMVNDHVTSCHRHAVCKSLA
ncbi:DNA-3-methyladenine glycosylase I [Teredinibacter turnerae]|uniref:DNA-3-methyladenine glycosylase I n=1 Tax=Teredinibacter turnerae TaxID=2426 RepID=UPI000377181E|nr:DNA-3-methyladenine glycosylase I [Teredinibacter turnerae]